MLQAAIRWVFCIVALLHGATARAGDADRSGDAGDLGIVRLLVEDAVRPLAVGTGRPAFSWILSSAARGAAQSAYRITLVRRQPSGGDGPTVWDSGTVASPRSTQVVFAGTTPLAGDADYHWTLRVWDAQGRSTTAGPEPFSTALLDTASWKAAWIGERGTIDPEPFWKEDQFRGDLVEGTLPIRQSSLLLRRGFTLRAKPVRARAYVTGLGFYELHLNGGKVGDHVLAPARTHYRARVLYDAYDVCDRLVAGANAIGMELAGGWYNPPQKYWGWRMQWYGPPRGILQLQVTYADGGSETLASDDGWRWLPGPSTETSIYDGERFDARCHPVGWDRPGFAAADWKAVDLLPAPGGVLEPQTMPPERVVGTLPAKRMLTPKPGVQVFDFGQNISGWTRITVRGAAGTEIRLHHAEFIEEDGTLKTRTNRLAAATDVFILAGTGEEVFEPRFTYHGFQYVEVTGWPGTPRLDDIAARMVCTDSRPIGSFTCSNGLVQRIHDATFWSQRAALHGLPVDCPQRDERLGWMADAHVTADEAMCNLDMAGSFRKWLGDMRTGQDVRGDINYIAPIPRGHGTPDWSSALHLIAWTCWMNTGDRRFLADNFLAMKRYVDFLTTTAKDGILPPAKYGDWMGTDVKKGDLRPMSTGFYHACARITAATAEVLGETADHQRYASLAQGIADAYQRAYFDPVRRGYCSETIGFQCCQAFPLWLGVVPKDAEAAVLAGLIADIDRRGGHLTTGIIGTNCLFQVLDALGRNDVGWRLATATGYPSWDGMLAGGRNTLAEKWDGGGSGNHVMFGSVDAWFYRSLAGIRPDPARPGYEQVVLKPFMPQGLDAAGASLDTVRGPLVSQWRKEGGRIAWEIRIPVGSTALVHLPSGSAADIRDNGQPFAAATGVTGVAMADGRVTCRLACGSYRLTWPEERHPPVR